MLSITGVRLSFSETSICFCCYAANDNTATHCGWNVEMLRRRKVEKLYGAPRHRRKETFLYQDLCCAHVCFVFFRVGGNE